MISSHPELQEKVNSGNFMISPPFKADSCAKIPSQVMLADCLALGYGDVPVTKASIKACTKCGCEPQRVK